MHALLFFVVHWKKKGEGLTWMIRASCQMEEVESAPLIAPCSCGMSQDRNKTLSTWLATVDIRHDQPWRAHDHDAGLQRLSPWVLFLHIYCRLPVGSLFAALLSISVSMSVPVWGVLQIQYPSQGASSNFTACFRGDEHLLRHGKEHPHLHQTFFNFLCTSHTGSTRHVSD